MKKFFLFIIFSFLSLTTHAFSQDNNMCNVFIENTPNFVESKMASLDGDLFGKKITYWTENDFISIINALKQCKGYKSSDGAIVLDEYYYNESFGKYKDKILNLSKIQQKASDSISGMDINTINLNDCLSLVFWKRNIETEVNNSKDIFGKDFQYMTSKERSAAKEFTNQCLPFAKIVLSIYREDIEKAPKIFDDIVYVIDLEEKAFNEPRRADGGLRATINGRDIPLAFVDDRAKEIIMIVDRSVRSGTQLNPNLVSRVVEWASSTNADVDSNAYEKAFAKKIMSFINDKAFN